MLNARQKEILSLLEKHPSLQTKDLQQALKLTRARVNQLIIPLISRENWELRRRVMELEKSLDDRKIIERAKEILISQFDILPTEAYRKLQEQSMESGKTMREIAERILSAYEL
jgi:AmiR/NasT family two-component response regulator